MYISTRFLQALHKIVNKPLIMSIFTTDGQQVLPWEHSAWEDARFEGVVFISKRAVNIDPGPETSTSLCSGVVRANSFSLHRV